GYARRALAAHGSQLALQYTHARFPSIVRDYLAYRVVAHLERHASEAVLLSLLWQQVALGYLQFLLVRVACELDDVHAVEQRARDGVSRVRGGYEEHV